METGTLYLIDGKVKCNTEEKPRREDYEIDGCENACEHYTTKWQENMKDVVNMKIHNKYSVHYYKGFDIFIPIHRVEGARCKIIQDGEGVRVTNFG